MFQPRLIVVCGAPATGKTTLARRLAADLGLSLLEKDAIKEALAAEAGSVPDRDASRRIGVESYRRLYDAARALLDSGADVMVEANLYRQWAGPELAQLATLAKVTIVQLVAPDEEIVRRYRARATEGDRHAVHRDLDALPDLLAGLENGAYDLSTLGYPTVEVDTLDGYRPGYDALLATLRSGIE